jgi:hypothetical protein
MLSRDEIILEYLERLPFAPYAVQEEAMYAWAACEQGVLLSAPTGGGRRSSPTRPNLLRIEVKTRAAVRNDRKRGGSIVAAERTVALSAPPVFCRSCGAAFQAANAGPKPAPQ